MFTILLNQEQLLQSQSFRKLIEENGFTSHEELRTYMDNNHLDYLWDYPEEELDYIIQEGKENTVIPIEFKGIIRFYEFID